MDNNEARQQLQAYNVLTDPSDSRTPLQIVQDLGQKGILPLLQTPSQTETTEV